MLCEASDVELIYDHVLHRDVRVRFGAPVKIVPDDACFEEMPHADLFAPDALPGHRLGVNVEQDVVLVEDQASLGFVRPVEAEGILKILDIEAEDEHGVDVADPVFLGKRYDRVGFGLLAVEEKQLAGGRAARMDREIHGIRIYDPAVGIVVSGQDKCAVHLIQSGTNVISGYILYRRQLLFCI